MELRAGTSRQARMFLLLVCLTLLSAAAASLYFDLHGSDQQYATLAAEVARSFYRAIDAVRDWNLRQGGVYVRESPEAVPSPYLSDSLREITAGNGEKMAMISHAHMTRLLSDVLTQGRGIHMHITSLTPIRPENKPDEWESDALRRFEQGSGEEYYQIAASGSQSTFRYMAPLKNQETCHTCHDRSEDSQRIRGAISVSFDYTPFLEIQGIQTRRILAAHGIFVLFGLALTGIMGGKLLNNIHALQESLDRIKRLEGFLPICSNCKKIRLEGADHKVQDSWIGVEQYIQERTDAEFTHGLCPQCAAVLYPEIFKKKESPSGN